MNRAPPLSREPFYLYLHGFLSSPLSKKAQQTIQYCRQFGQESHILVPTLSSGPADTIEELGAIVEAQQSRAVALLGSSLGGFYATCLAEEYNLPVVLINPAVRPADYWETHLGEHKNYYSDEVYTVTEQHIEELRLLDNASISNPDNFWVLLQKGDETMDYRRAVEKYGESHCLVREDGSHSYDNYEAELPAIFDFLLSRID